VLKIKKSKKSSTKPVQVKVKIPITTVSITSMLLIGLLSGIGYSGYLGAKSLWNFTHPQFNVSLDTFRALAYVAKGTEIPPLSLPTFPVDKVPDINTQLAYLAVMKEFKDEFRVKYPKSGLLNISDNELINMGWAFCEVKDEAIAKDGKFVRDDIIEAFQSKYVLRYPAMNGLGIYIDGVGQRAFDYLCRSN
jgi:hypothetical protein